MKHPTLHLALVCAAAVPPPGFTVHVCVETEPERIVRVKTTGSDSVLDAISSLKRLPDLAKMDLWIERRGAAGKAQVLRIDWRGITVQGRTNTNFVLLPGDRLFLRDQGSK